MESKSHNPVSVSKDHDAETPKTGKPNEKAASALLEDYYFWLLRSGKLAHRGRGDRGKKKILTAKVS